MVLFVWSEGAPDNRPVEHELNEVYSNGNDGAVSEPSEPPQSTVHIDPVDTPDEQLYSEIEDEATSPQDPVAPPLVYQTGSRSYYEGLQVVSPDTEPRRPLPQPTSVYDKLTRRGGDDNNAETLVKRVSSLPTRRLPNTLWQNYYLPHRGSSRRCIALYDCVCNDVRYFLVMLMPAYLIETIISPAIFLPFPLTLFHHIPPGFIQTPRGL